MCLTASYLAMFLTLMGPDQISAEPGRYIVHAETRDAHWVAAGDGEHWCTMAPQIDTMQRLASLRVE
ncbi:hypothetical protein JANAI62_20550 [Jannaschia pagri]|uniref:Uncharacterized protein n=1 Tax=Jannaschia pagri TaxID=2829797 RepID=A0ABQ4NM03_9RHOB|nr:MULTISPECIES: hypothetical protein [unclassified Jannaschia]GIT91598.1 hypothetical protein JANAI61_20560 [Jannaschia sp. AI_61]GIT95432.1 hypothetical protein JANAI62_20550 [Jannaschia sp. AI_62]